MDHNNLIKNRSNNEKYKDINNIRAKTPSINNWTIEELFQFRGELKKI